MNTVPIVFAFDNNLVMPACIAISSLLMNAREDTFYDIFILHSGNAGLKKEELDRLPALFRNCRLQYRLVDSIFDNSFEIREITTPAYYRLLIPDLIPEYDKILYSDVDVIFRTDLYDIYANTSLEDCYLGGVNSLACLIPENLAYYNRMGLDASGIIYSGNLIFNSRKIREDGIIPKFKMLARNKYKFQDMDILNIVCKNKIKYLPPEFCFTTYISQWSVYNRSDLLAYWSEEELERAAESGIVHYNGQKPWKGICVNFDIWWEYYRKSPFYKEKYYFDYYYDRLNLLDQLSLWKRIKILVRYFIYGKKK